MTEEKHTISVLLELTETLVGDVSLDEALRAVTDAALQLLPGAHSSVRVLDNQGNLLCGARSGEGRKRSPVSLRRGEGLSGWVAASGQPVRVADATTDPRFQRVDHQGFAIRSMLAVPLLSMGRVVGVLGVTSPEPDIFTAEHEIMALLLANCAVPAIEKARLERLRQRAEKLAVTDTQTTAFNQRYLFPRLRAEIDKARGRLLPLSILLMDLDDFKEVNDQFGHSVGDELLSCFADNVLSCVRNSDVLVRRGGDEFVLLMPDTSHSRATEVAQRVRAEVAQTELGDPSRPVRRTVSIGVATWDGTENAKDLERRADLAMYEAKRRGRDQVVSAATE